MHIADAARFGRKKRLGLLRMRKFSGYFLHDAARFVQKLLHSRPAAFVFLDGIIWKSQ